MEKHAPPRAQYPRLSALATGLTLVFLAIVLLAPGCAFVATGDSQQVKVVRVIDGDTIEIQGGYRVRYIGMDAPEVYPMLECYGQEATARNRELIGGKVVTLKKDVTERDIYDRLLRYVYVDGTFVNGELVRGGFARARSYPPDTRYQGLLQELEKEARDHRAGLWGACP